MSTAKAVPQESGLRNSISEHVNKQLGQIERSLAERFDGQPATRSLHETLQQYYNNGGKTHEQQ